MAQVYGILDLFQRRSLHWQLLLCARLPVDGAARVVVADEHSSTVGPVHDCSPKIAVASQI